MASEKSRNSKLCELVIRTQDKQCASVNQEVPDQRQWVNL